MRSRLFGTGLVLAALTARSVAVTPASAQPTSAALRVGALTLQPCSPQSRAWCGSRPEPFDRNDPGAGTIDIGFMWFPASSQPVKGTILAEEGGPGFPANTFAPFSTREWLHVDAYDEAYTACLNWPPPVRDDPPITITPPLVPSTLPVLVLGGDLDSLTPLLGGGRLVARQMGSSARLVVVPNTVHVTALGDPFHCAPRLVRALVLDPSALPTLDTSCTKRVAEIRVVGRFVRTLAEAVAASPTSGDEAGVEGLRAATVAAAAAGDAMYRSRYVSGPDGTGLRGGTYTSASPRPGVTDFRLRDARWVDNLTVDGLVTLSQLTGVITATLQVRGDGGATGSMTVTWAELAVHAVATVEGTWEGRRLAAVLPAP